MKYKYFLLLFLLPLLSFPQGEANNWYFGFNAGVSFNTSPPTPLLNGQLTTSEGCSSISDEDGNLLFYTDGRTVWNRNHQIMSNANYFGGTGLLGDPSSTSSGLIVPHPTNADIYFVFTVDEPHHDNAAAFPNQGPANQNGVPVFSYTDTSDNIPQGDDGFNNGLNYSAVDMSLNNGLGDVLPDQHNLPLITYNPNDTEEVKFKCSEKITAVKGKDCNTFWVITHFINTFYAFKVNENGVDENPVTSTVGPEIPIAAYRRSAIGYIKASPDGSKLLIAHETKTYNQVGTNSEEDGGVYLYDFNNETGEVSNNQALLENAHAYGVEFSAQTKKAYATATQGGNILKLFQWDLENNDIPGSITEIPGVTGTIGVALQLAPNGKIYLSKIQESKLAVINNPELSANTVNYSENTANGAINLQGRLATFGLPPFIQSIFASRINIINEDEAIVTDLSLCNEEEYELMYEDIPGATYTWFMNDELLPNETSHSLVITQSSATLPLTDHYRLKVDVNDEDCTRLLGIANITYLENPEVSNASLTECNFEDADTSIFDLTNAEEALTNGSIGNPFIEIAYFLSFSAAENNENPILNPQQFSNTQNPQQLIAKVTNTNTGCSSYPTLTLSVNANNILGVTLTQCDEQGTGIHSFDLTEARQHFSAQSPAFTIDFYRSRQDAVTQENKITNEQNFTNTTPNEQFIFARIESGNTCFSIAEVQLVVDNEIPATEAQEELIYCTNTYPEKITLSSDIPNEEEANYSYLWQPSGETTSNIEINEIGTYTLIVTNIERGCTVQKEFVVKASNKAIFSISHTNFITDNTVTINLSEESIGIYEYAIDNPTGQYQDETSFTHIPAGKHIVYVNDKNGCGISTEELYILGAMKFFTPNNDGVNDTWEIIGNNGSNLFSIKVFIFDRFGKLLKEYPGSNLGWDGTYHGKPMPSNDYWYKIVMEDGKSFRGNFTLVR